MLHFLFHVIVVLYLIIALICWAGIFASCNHEKYRTKPFLWQLCQHLIFIATSVLWFPMMLCDKENWGIPNED